MVRKLALFAIALVWAASPLGCADRLGARDADLEVGPNDDGSAPADLPRTSGNFTHTALGDGSIISTVVDAKSADDWQKLDLDSGYADTGDWDLSFRRFGVLSNGGVSGSGGVRLLALPGENFEAVTQAPGAEAGWGVDLKDGEDDDTSPDNVFSDWYDYDVTTHALTPKDTLFLVRSTAGLFYKLRIEDYYDEAGTSAVVSFRWARIKPPEEDLIPSDVDPEPAGPDDAGTDDDGTPQPANTIYVDARSYDDWVYVKLDEGVVAIARPDSSSDWDLAIQRFVFRTNSGTSGQGDGGVKLDDTESHYDDVDSTTGDGFRVDELLEIEGPSGATTMSTNAVLEDWYDYQPDHTLDPKPNTYVVRAARGDAYAKLRIHRYVSGELLISLLPLALSIP